MQFTIPLNSFTSPAKALFIGFTFNQGELTLTFESNFLGLS